MIDIYIAEKKDYPKAAALWQAGFGDSREVAEGFLARLAGRDRLLLLDSGGSAAAMAVLIYAPIACGGGEIPAYCVYAFTTEPQYRARGFGTALLDFAYSLAEGDGAGLFLRPAEPALFSYYEKRGFRTAFSYSERALTLEVGSGVLMPMTPECYAAARREVLRRTGVLYVDWRAETIAALDGCLFEVRGGGVRAIAEIERYDKLCIKELLCLEGDTVSALAAIGAHYGAADCTLRLLSENGGDFGMYRGREPFKNAYYGLAFD